MHTDAIYAIMYTHTHIYIYIYYYITITIYLHTYAIYIYILPPETFATISLVRTAFPARCFWYQRALERHTVAWLTSTNAALTWQRKREKKEGFEGLTRSKSSPIEKTRSKLANPVELS